MEREYWPSRNEVLTMIRENWTAVSTVEEINLEDAIGRINAEPIYAVHHLPVVRASSMDGIGVVAELFANGIPDTSSWIAGQEYVRADTGDDFDDKYDAVIPIEKVTILQPYGIVIDPDVTVKKGMCIRPSGSYLATGDLLVDRGTKLTPSDLAALVAGGITSLKVIKKPVVVFIPTGSELLPAGSKAVRGKNIDSNTILVKHMLIEMGADPLCNEIVPDDREKLAGALDSALVAADIVIINGGSSKGEEDFNASLLGVKGRVLCHNVAAAPGRPMCVAMVNNKPVINIPGPSIACYYGMDWCIRSLVNECLGQPMIKRKTINAMLTEEIRYSKGMEILCKMEIWQTEQGYQTRQVPFRNATVVENLSAPGQYITKPELDGHDVGEVIEVELLRDEG